MRAAAFLQTSRHDSIYYFRRRVPADLQPALRRVQFTVSLRTADRRTAVVRARVLAVQTDALFSRMRKRSPAAEDDLSSEFTALITFDEHGNEKSISITTDPGDPADGERGLEAIRALRSGPQSPKAPPAVPQTYEALGVAVARYLAGSRVKQSTVLSYKTQLAQFVAHFGPAFNAHDIGQSLFTKYCESVKDDPSRAPKTQGNYIGAAGTFLNWFRDQIDGSTPIKVKKLKPRAARPGDNERQPFNPNEMRVLLTNAARYRLSQPAKFWSTVAVAFLGARIEEVAQLNLTTDLMTLDEGNTWFLNLLEGEDADGEKRQSIKTKAGHRRVPIHSALVRHGFVDFLQTAALSSTHRPFADSFKPYQHKAGGPPKWSQYLGKWGGRELERLRKGGELSAAGCTYFHSWRHTFSTELGLVGVSMELRSAIMGHEHGGENARYTHLRKQPAMLREHVESGLKRVEAIFDAVMVDSLASPAAP